MGGRTHRVKYGKVIGGVNLAHLIASGIVHSKIN